MSFEKLAAYMDTLSRHHIPACDMVVYRDHELLFRHMAGHRDAAGTEPLRGDETYCLFSGTKVATSCAAMQLIEKGLLSLDDAVSDYLPAFARLTVKDGDAVCPAKRVMTVRHLMSMSGGLTYDTGSASIRAAVAASGGEASTREVVSAMAGEPLAFEPGTDFLYSLCHDVLAAVIEVAAGKRFSRVLRENLFEPLDMRTVTFDATDEVRARMCPQYVYDGERDSLVQRPADPDNYRITANYESGGAGLITDVRDYGLFADALACGGESRDGMHILSPEMIQLWSANQLGPKGRRSFDEWKRLGYSYALGVRTRVDLTKGGGGPLNEFGWDGAAGAWVMIDPLNHVSAFYASHVRNYNYSYDVIHPTLRTLLYEGLEA